MFFAYFLSFVASVYAWGNQTLLEAVQEGALDSLDELIATMSQGDLGMRYQDGRTLLMHAVYQGLSELVVSFISAGADVNASRTDGVTALNYAAWAGHAEGVNLLLDAAADASAERVDGLNAADLARQKGHLGIAEMLESLPDETESNQN